MARSTPMILTFYGEDDEVLKEFSRSFVPWKILKKAIKLYKNLKPEDLADPTKIDEETIDAISGLVVETFGDQFSIQELDDHVDVGDMMAVLQTIIAKASGISPNPTPPGR